MCYKPGFQSLDNVSAVASQGYNMHVCLSENVICFTSCAMLLDPDTHPPRFPVADNMCSWCAHRLYCLPCRFTVNDMLVQADLGRFFQAFVTAEDGMDTISQRFLSACIKLGRPPNQCVVFESSPAGITAAHNCTMKVCCISQDK